MTLRVTSTLIALLGLWMFGPLPGAQAQHQVSTNIPVGLGPIDIAITPDGSLLFVNNRDSNDVSVIDAELKAEIGTIPAGIHPHRVEVSPDGTEVWVSNRLSGSVSVIDVATLTIVATIGIGNLVDDVRFSPDGGRVYVASARVTAPIEVKIIDVATRVVVDSFATSLPQDYIQISPDGQTAYLGQTDTFSPSVQTSVVDLASKTIGDTIPGMWPQVISQNGLSAWGIDIFQGRAVLADLVSNTVVASIPVNPRPFALALSPDGQRAYVSNDMTSSVTVIDTQTTNVTEVIPVGDTPHGLVTDPEGESIYVVNHGDNTVSVIEPVFELVEVDIKPGSFPNSINLGSNGKVPVAILSSPEFNATAVDPLSVTLASAAVWLKGNGTPMASFSDANEDGLTDLVVHVSTEALLLTPTDTQAVVEGVTFDGVAFKGTDTVRIVPGD